MGLRLYLGLVLLLACSVVRAQFYIWHEGGHRYISTVPRSCIETNLRGGKYVSMNCRAWESNIAQYNKLMTEAVTQMHAESDGLLSGTVLSVIPGTGLLLTDVKIDQQDILLSPEKIKRNQALPQPVPVIMDTARLEIQQGDISRFAIGLVSNPGEKKLRRLKNVLVRTRTESYVDGDYYEGYVRVAGTYSYGSVGNSLITVRSYTAVDDEIAGIMRKR